MALCNITVFVPNLPDQTPNQQALQLAQTLGARVASSCSESVDVIVADSLLGDWYLAASKLPHVPVCVKVSWLQASAEAGTKVPYQQHRIMGLEGLKLCLTGLNDTQQRDMLSCRIKAAGGVFSADLLRDCTHLIAFIASGAKYKYALSWGLHVVSPAWLDACCKLCLRQDEAPFAVKPAQSQAQTASNGSMGEAPQMGGVNSRPATSGSTASRVQQTATTVSNKLPPAAPAASYQQPGGKPPVRPPTSTTTTTTNSAPYIPPPNPTDSCLFLDWVHFHVVGATADEALLIRQLVAQGGAIREVTLNARVTHVIVGSDAGPADLAAVREHWVSWKEHVRVVKLAWLKECVAARTCLEPVDPALCVQLGSSVNRMGSMLDSAGSGMLGVGLSSGVGALPTLPGLVSAASVDFLELASMDTRSRAPEVMGPGGAGPGAVWQEQPLGREPGGALKGLWFTLAAAPHDKELGGLVRSNGGQVFTADSLRKVRDLSKAFALCPPGLSSFTVTDLEKSAQDFRCVPGMQRVTGYWLQECIRQGKLLNPGMPEQPAFRPLPFDLPLPGFTNFRVHVAGYRADQITLKKGVTKALQMMGALITTELSQYNTHLVLPECGTPKYDLACKLGIVMVSEAWVLHIASTGRVPDPWEARFRPCQESAQQRQLSRQQHLTRRQQEEAGAGRSKQDRVQAQGSGPAPGATQLGPTQLGAATQAAAGGTGVQEDVVGAGGGAAAGAVGKSVRYSAASGFKLLAIQPDASKVGDATGTGSSAIGVEPGRAGSGGDGVWGVQPEQAAAPAVKMEAGAGQPVSSKTAAPPAARQTLQPVNQNLIQNRSNSGGSQPGGGAVQGGHSRGRRQVHVGDRMCRGVA